MLGVTNDIISHEYINECYNIFGKYLTKSFLFSYHMTYILCISKWLKSELHKKKMYQIIQKK